MTTPNCCEVSFLEIFPKEKAALDDKCPICQATYREMANEMQPIAMTSCGKYFDGNCMSDYIRNGFTTCSCCRQTIKIIKAPKEASKGQNNQIGNELALAVNSIIVGSSLIGYVNIVRSLMTDTSVTADESSPESSWIDSFRLVFTVGCAVYTSIRIGIAARRLYSSSRN